MFGCSLEWLSTRKGNSLSFIICWECLWGHRWMQQWRENSAFVCDTSLLGTCGMGLKAQVGFQSMHTFQPTHFVWTVIWSGSAWHHHLVFYTRRYLIVCLFVLSKIRYLLFSTGFHPPAEAGGSLQSWALHPCIERLQMWYLKRTKQCGRVWEEKVWEEPSHFPQGKLSWVWPPWKLLLFKSEGK